MAACLRQLPGSGFSSGEIEEAVKNARLLTVEIELSRGCSSRGPYTDLPERSVTESELTEGEIRDLIVQAGDLGVRKIIILGGEPASRSHFVETVRFIRSKHLEVEMFTDGSGITPDLATRLLGERVGVVVKMDSLNESVQNVLTAGKGPSSPFKEALRHLKRAGYPSEEAVLAVSAIICRQNVDELVSLWRWLRDQHIIPCFAIATPAVIAEHDDWPGVDPRRLQELFTEVANIDTELYGERWDPQPPLLGSACVRHKFSCLVRWQGDVVPCVGLDIPIGNIREQRLHDIISDSEVLQDLKDHRHTIKGPCRFCEKADNCYGCRGMAYQSTGDYLASDPSCWKNAERQGEIKRLPLAVEELIPQRSPMRVIDALVRIGERSGEVSVTVSNDTPFVGEDGDVGEVTYFEMMAQSVAAVHGFKQLGSTDTSSEGYLVGAQKLEILGTARVGDTLKVSVYKEARFGKLGIVKGIVSRDGTVLARGEVKIWHDPMESRQHPRGSGG